MKTVYMGIDPGLLGGIAIVSDEAASAIKMPETPKDLWESILSISKLSGYCFCVLEKVHTMPRQGIVSAFTFGNGVGHLQMALIAAGIPFEEISPQKWMKELKCLTKGDKSITKRKAQEMFPNIKVTNYIADALLIAEFARRRRTN